MGKIIERFQQRKADKAKYKHEETMLRGGYSNRASVRLSRSDVKMKRSDTKDKRAQVKQTLAEQGIDATFMGNLSKGVSSIFGGGQTNPDYSGYGQPTFQQPYLNQAYEPGATMGQPLIYPGTDIDPGTNTFDFASSFKYVIYIVLGFILIKFFTKKSNNYEHNSR